MNIPVGFGQVNFLFTGNAYPRGAQVALGFDNGDDIAATIIALSFAANWATNVMPVLSNACNLAGVKVKLGPNSTGAETTVASATVGGISATQPMSPQVAPLVKKRTALGGRINNGRIYLPGMVEGYSDGAGRLTSAAQTALQDAMTAFFDGSNDDGNPLVVLHTNVALTPNLITALDVQQLVGTQKRRIRRAGGRRAA